MCGSSTQNYKKIVFVSFPLESLNCMVRKVLIRYNIIGIVEITISNKFTKKKRDKLKQVKFKRDKFTCSLSELRLFVRNECPLRLRKPLLAVDG